MRNLIFTANRKISAIADSSDSILTRHLRTLQAAAIPSVHLFPLADAAKQPSHREQREKVYRASGHPGDIAAVGRARGDVSNWPLND
jgi:hypothetical protein